MRRYDPEQPKRKQGDYEIILPHAKMLVGDFIFQLERVQSIFDDNKKTAYIEIDGTNIVMTPEWVDQQLLRAYEIRGLEVMSVLYMIGDNFRWHSEVLDIMVGRRNY